MYIYLYVYIYMYTNVLYLCIYMYVYIYRYTYIRNRDRFSFFLCTFIYFYQNTHIHVHIYMWGAWGTVHKASFCLTHPSRSLSFSREGESVGGGEHWGLGGGKWWERVGEFAKGLLRNSRSCILQRWILVMIVNWNQN